MAARRRRKRRRRGDCGGRLSERERDTKRIQTDSQAISAEVGKWSYKKT
jgi:hypothetical protein